MRKFSSNDYRRMPWKNGGGVTTQLAIWPEDADLSSFDLRISTADIAKPGPFSLFAGCDRSLAVLRGAGIALEFDGLSATILTPSNLPLRFGGEQQVRAALLDGPVTDFNIISRRSRWSHTLERLALNDKLRRAINADRMFVYCAQGGAVQIRLPSGKTVDCAEGNAVMLDASDGAHADFSASSSLLYLARFTAKGNTHAE
ncbi:MAG TPA: HutD family protein [Noviherbaspirillum sp.]